MIVSVCRSDKMNAQKVLVTGSAGFIGFHLSKILLDRGIEVIGIDNINNYYAPILKEKRLQLLRKYDGFTFYKVDFSKWSELSKVGGNVDIVIHLGAQPGVRYSLVNPFVYGESNLQGTLNVFEYARRNDVSKVIYASSSSVYGGNTKIPFSEEDDVNKPISLYASTKRSNELMAYTYHHLYGIKMIGLRFFTVYGEFGRPDMAYWIFSKKIMKGEEIDVFNYGKMSRDFTYIEDAVQGILLAMEKDFEYEIFNIGNDSPVELEEFISLLEKYLGKKAKKRYMPLQPGDVERTWADLSKSRNLLGYKPKVGIEEGLRRFCGWFIENWDWIKDI